MKYSKEHLWKNWEILQNFQNWAGDQIKLQKQESPAQIGRVGMSVNGVS